jgi:hypothetical protein
MGAEYEHEAYCWRINTSSVVAMAIVVAFPITTDLYVNARVFACTNKRAL